MTVLQPKVSPATPFSIKVVPGVILDVRMPLFVDSSGALDGFRSSFLCFTISQYLDLNAKIFTMGFNTV